MTKFNLVEEKITVSKPDLMLAINSQKEFAITHLGAVVYAPFSKTDIFIYKGTLQGVSNSGVMVQKPMGLSDIFGVLYKLDEQEDVVVFDASGAWAEIVIFNQENASYDDSTSDGIMDLGDKELEEMAWHSTEFGINNREISDVIEEGCQGTLFCIHKEAPFIFSSLIYIDDIECARAKVREAIKGLIIKKIDNDPDFKRENLTEDELEAAAFFGL